MAYRLSTPIRCVATLGTTNSPRCTTPAGSYLSTAFKDSRRASGLEWKTSPPSFHELRSLSARLHKKENGEEFSQHLLGHKSAEMTAKYHDERSDKWVFV
ncbi:MULTISPECIES: tyrosine-type recombinase/integrase [unclassified Serratia (in: enterobacteria)]|uniref:Tyrosine-type recombinase/integrase n=1 Tax=Serratia fonticola TaxID=47917 RepID=A0AAE7EI44_SERFO|nr:tyrosine-type recombinase/integrase [Serratia fonticola]HEJ9059520.1 tyrosine-type recombinase/integrase [Serratia fonticola]